MLSAITLAEISANSVVYNHYIRLFPFSPRREVDPNLEVIRVFRDRYEQLTEKPTGNTILEIFAGLRREVAQSDEGLCRWVACLALVRTWRDGVETVKQIAEATQKIASYG